MKIKKFDEFSELIKESCEYNNVITSLDEILDELVGRGDYEISYHENEDRFYISFDRPIDEIEMVELSNKVIDYLDKNECGVYTVGNYTDSMFWIADV